MELDRAETHNDPGSYYCARYYDAQIGRFLSEDPVSFMAGTNFYRYVYNSPVRLGDPTGLSPQDVQRILAKCKKCTKDLSDSGQRVAWAPGGVLNILSGWATDLLSWGGKKQSCYGQAVLTKPCLEDPKPPYDDRWTFGVVTAWLGGHRVVVGTDSDPSDPIVICDPWMNQSYTVPKPPLGPNGGGTW